LAIKIEDLDLSEGEVEIYTQKVLLEKADTASWSRKAGSEGYLILTNKRLLFLYIVKEEEVKKFFGVTMSTEVYPDPQLTKIREYANIEKYLSSEYSFVIPLRQVATIEKIGGEFNPLKFVRIGIVDNNGLRVNYCIHEMDVHWGQIDLDKWFNWLNHAKGVEPYISAIRRRKIPLADKILFAGLLGIISFILVVVAIFAPDLESFLTIALLLSTIAVPIIFEWSGMRRRRHNVLLLLIIISILIEGAVLSADGWSLVSLIIIPVVIAILVIILVKQIMKETKTT
jgi:hypothetical protein